MEIYWPFQSQSILIIILMFIGLYYRKNRKIHIRLMSTVIAWDLLLILQIELARSAIGKAEQVMKNPAILNIHVALAVTTVLFYGAMIYTGRKILKQQHQFRKIHRFFGITTVVLRLLTFFTSFFAA